MATVNIAHVYTQPPAVVTNLSLSSNLPIAYVYQSGSSNISIQGLGVVFPRTKI